MTGDRLVQFGRNSWGGWISGAVVYEYTGVDESMSTRVTKLKDVLSEAGLIRVDTAGIYVL